MSDKIEITFTAGARVLDHTGAVSFEAAAGDSVTLNPASAARWVNRGMAIYGKPEPVKPAAPEKPKKAEKPKK